MTMAAGGFNALGGFFGGRQEADEANRRAVNAYRERLKAREFDYALRSSEYNQRRLRAQQQYQENYTAANRAYMSEQNRINEIYRKAGFDTQGRRLDLQKEIGSAAARGVSGQSAQLARQSSMAAFGRNEAIQAQSLIGADTAYNTAVTDIRDKLKIDNRTAYNTIGQAPLPSMLPISPTMTQGPSLFSLGTGLIGAATEGFSTENAIRKERGQKPLFS